MGFIFGRWVGTVLVVVAATLGATLVFLAARYLFADSARKRLGAVGEKINAGFTENAFAYLLFLRLVPAFPFFLVNLAPAFTAIPLRTYVARHVDRHHPGDVRLREPRPDAGPHRVAEGPRLRARRCWRSRCSACSRCCPSRGSGSASANAPAKTPMTRTSSHALLALVARVSRDRQHHRAGADHGAVRCAAARPCQERPRRLPGLPGQRRGFKAYVAELAKPAKLDTQAPNSSRTTSTPTTRSRSRASSTGCRRRRSSAGSATSSCRSGRSPDARSRCTTSSTWCCVRSAIRASTSRSSARRSPALSCAARRSRPRSSTRSSTSRLASSSTTRSRNRFDKARKTAHLSEIFKWFDEDFRGAGSVQKYIAKYVDDAEVAKDACERRLPRRMDPLRLEPERHAAASMKFVHEPNRHQASGSLRRDSALRRPVQQLRRRRGIPRDHVGIAAFLPRRPRGPGPHPDRTIARIRESYVVCIQGNHDHAVGHDQRDCGCGYVDPRDREYAQVTFDYTAANTSAPNKAWLRVAARADPARLARQADPARPWQPRQRQRVRVGKRDRRREARRAGLPPSTWMRSARPTPDCLGCARRPAAYGATSACSAGRRMIETPRVGYALLHFGARRHVADREPRSAGLRRRTGRRGDPRRRPSRRVRAGARARRLDDLFQHPPVNRKATHGPLRQPRGTRLGQDRPCARRCRF